MAMWDIVGSAMTMGQGRADCSLTGEVAGERRCGGIDILWPKGSCGSNFVCSVQVLCG